MTLGKRIAKKRSEQKLTQEAFGEKMGVSRQSVYRWEQDASVPEIEKLVEMSKLFGVSMDWLLGNHGAQTMSAEQLAVARELADSYATAHRKAHQPWLRLVAVLAAVSIVVSVIWMAAALTSLSRQIDALREQISMMGTVSPVPETSRPPVTTQLPATDVPESTGPDLSLDPGQIVGRYVPVVYMDVLPMDAWGGKDDVRIGMMYFESPVEGDVEGSFNATFTIRPQGSSSLAYDKKNFTIELLDGGREMMSGWGEQTEFCLKANYIDPTHACNVVSARLAGQMNSAWGVLREAPNGGSVDGFPIWLVINGKAMGLYTWCIPKSAWMFGMDAENGNHIVMCGEGPLPGCQFLSESYKKDTEWSVEVGVDEEAAFGKFDRLYRFIADSSEEEFREHFHEYLDLDACLNYYCYAMVSNAQDNLDNNLLLATYDGQVWLPAMYDLDSLWGVKWDGKDTVADTAVSICQNEGALWVKLRACFGDELKVRYAELRSGVLSEDNIWSAFDEFAAGIPQPYYDYDTAMWNADGTMIRTLALMKQCVAEYLPEVDAEMGYTAP